MSSQRSDLPQMPTKRALWLTVLLQNRRSAHLGKPVTWILSFLTQPRQSRNPYGYIVDIHFGNQETLTFKLDTGAEVTAISLGVLSFPFHFPPPLSTPDKVLYDPSRQTLQVQGQCVCQLSFKGRACKQQVFIVKGLKNNLLGLPAIISLSLARD